MSTVPMTETRQGELLAEDFEEIIYIVFAESGPEGGFSGENAGAVADDYISYLRSKYPAYRNQNVWKVCFGKVRDAPVGAPNWEAIE